MINYSTAAHRLARAAFRRSIYNLDQFERALVLFAVRFDYEAGQLFELAGRFGSVAEIP